MLRKELRWTIAVISLTPAVAVALDAQPQPPARSADHTVGAELDTQRVLGRGYYENDKFAEATEAFRRCTQLAPDSAVDRFNLSLVLMRAAKYDESLRTVERALQLDPDLLAASYLRGIVYKRQGSFDKAAENLERVIKHDPQCTGAHYNLGVCHKTLQDDEKAIQAFKRAAELAPEHPSAHYQLMTLYRRLGDVDNTKRQRAIFDQVKDKVDASEKTVEALERSKYSYLIEAPRLTRELEPRPPGEVRFVDATAGSGLTAAGKRGPTIPKTTAGPDNIRRQVVPSLCGAVALADFDGDGDPDIFTVNCSTDGEAVPPRLYQNDGKGKFTDVTEQAGVGGPGIGFDAVFGDYDNDGHTDLYVVNLGPNKLYRNKGDGTFQNVSQAAHVDEPQFGRRALFLDYDHDNDLDIFIANYVDLTAAPQQTGPDREPSDILPGQFNALLRNNGDGTFTEQTDEAGLLLGSEPSVDALFADFDGDHDIDLFVANDNGTSRSFANARLGKFTGGGSFSPPVPKRVSAVAEGDFNRDGHPDFIVATPGNLAFLYTNDGRAHFERTPVVWLPRDYAVKRVALFDYNNDGWTDILLLTGPMDRAMTDVIHPRLTVVATTAPSNLPVTVADVGLDTLKANAVDFATGDVDGDGDQDIVVLTRDRGLVLLENVGQKAVNWLKVRLVGKKVNKSAYGAAVEIAAGGHYQRQTARADTMQFGLGNLRSVDVVRVIWPNGVAQNVIRPQINSTVSIEEYVKVSASCGFLYTFNGTGFELVNEILGIGPLGVPMAPGVYHQPDTTELTKIESGQLVARDGYFDLRLTEELRETMYADQITLRVVDHPALLTVIPNEMFTAPPFPEDKFFAVAHHRPPLSALDDRGQDVLSSVLERDGRFPTFPLTPYDGLARPHTLTLDLGDLSGAKQIMLFLDGWIYWPESSTVMAIAQDPRFSIRPLSLEVRDARGQWHAAIESVGLPTSKGLVVPVDLTGRFLCDDHHVRLSTNLCIYFDRVFVSTRDQADRCRVTELPAADADLHYRGFSAMTRDRHGFERFNYAKVSPNGSWSPPAGFLTRYGDVTPLLARLDDMCVIFGPGDELSLRFDASRLPELPVGWTRDFIFYANGWVKDGDLNTKFSETVTPLPFHGMSRYPYAATDSPPDTPEHRRYHATYNTRPSKPTLARLPNERRGSRVP